MIRNYGKGCYAPDPNYNLPAAGWYGYTAYGRSAGAEAPVDNKNNRKTPVPASYLRNKQCWEK